MYRTILDFGSVGIRSYGVMLAIAFWVGIEVSARIARKRGYDQLLIVDLGLVILLSSVVGSRFLYVITHLSDFRFHSLAHLQHLVHNVDRRNHSVDPP